MFKIYGKTKFRKKKILIENQFKVKMIIIDNF